MQEIIETGAHDVLCITLDKPASFAAAQGGQMLIPYVDDFVQAVDLKEKVIRVDWPELADPTDPG